ncbi:hypothetical protein H257_05888 [Aphanomyces astaci]|uniref:Uncharacterized protein n=1 Tax=Aphanomyces astaci TaxID=112090 RepID=W4GNQ4_APHAT|nr:hypothetical protein H257_05888 [Aphanomyces astaci]ETV81342.1 hypothetical protein H257_05888 [Aphanomyces astaci]|eukprot:XP_009829200.1 hypothetical protein H257_05888 [Aphanomyces astaci]
MTASIVTSVEAAAQVDVDLRIKHSWMLTYPHIPLYVHDVWMDVVHRKGMEKWRVVQCMSSSHKSFVLVGILSLQALTARTSLPRRDADPNDLDRATWTAVICHADHFPFDMREVAHVRSSIALSCDLDAQLPRHLVLAITTQSPSSTSYYTLHDSLVV